jgi:hypothetical protein
MTKRARRVASATLACAVAAVSWATVAGGATPLKITSTLDGKSVLPLEIRWIAHPNVAPAKVAKVEFLVDGTLRGVEHAAPYNYGSDDFHGHLGSLITSWLPPGRHRFTVRVVLTDGRKASRTVVARVLPAPEPPAELAGRWQRTISTQEEIPSGTWQQVFDRVGVWDLDPIGTGIVEHVDVRGDVLVIDGAIWMTPYVNGHGKLSRFGHTDIGAGFREDGPPGSYRWSVSGNQLTLTAIDETSGPRRALWEGVWTRVGP